jgi:hypothetical protein
MEEYTGEVASGTTAPVSIDSGIVPVVSGSEGVNVNS